MNKIKMAFLFAALVIGVVGCNDVPPPTPQKQASDMLDAQISDVRNAISNHVSSLPGDRIRWQEGDIKIQDNLYARLDDLYRQRQLLAVTVGSQKYDPKQATSPHDESKTPR